MVKQQKFNTMALIIKQLGESPYSEVISRFFQLQFPGIIKVSGNNLMELLSALFIGTKENRYGPVPAPEVLVNIRRVITQAIEKNAPIPVLTVYGGIKGDMSGHTDVADVSAIRQLITLDQAIRKYYSPGLRVNFRVEDINAMWLYREFGADNAIKSYSHDMTMLIEILRGEADIMGVPESRLMDREAYFERSRFLSELIFAYMMISNQVPEEQWSELDAYKKLEGYGWKGLIPREQRDYYLHRYRTLYGETNELKMWGMMADYFGGSKARYDLKGRANPEVEGVDGYIGISFVPPVPGAPEGLFSTTIPYRTVPMSMARTHMPPWRSKSYLLIERDSVKTKLATFHDKQINDVLIPNQLMFGDEIRQVTVNAPYICND